MSEQPLFVKASAYMDDILALPVADAKAASRWYQDSFGLREIEWLDAPHKTVLMERGGMKIGFSENGGDSAQDGAAILVSDITRARDELESNGLEIGNWRIDEREGIKYQVFFIIAPDGLCYYFHQALLD